MIIELRKKSQITIPKEVIRELNLVEGDYLDLSVEDGIIMIEPVAVYSKSYVQKYEILFEHLWNIAWNSVIK